MDILIRLDGAVEETLTRLMDAGFFKTKTDAIRAGIIELGREYGAVKSREDYLDELAVAKVRKLEAEAKAGKRKTLTLSDVRKKYPEAFE